VTGPVAAGLDAPRRLRVLLATATLSQFAASMAQQGTVVLGVFFAATYHLTLGQMGGVVSSVTLGLVVSCLFVGSLVDRYGPRAVLSVGTALVVVAAATVGASHMLPQTVVLLFVLGMLLGAVPVAGTTAILTAWPRERRGLPLGIRQMGVPAGAMVAALALPALATRFGPQPMYFGFAVLLAVGGVAFCAVLPKPLRRTASLTVDSADDQRSAVPVGAMHASPAEEDQQSAVPPSRSAEGVLLRHEASHIVMPAATGFLMGWGQYAVATYTIPFLHDAHGISIATAGILLAVSQLGGGVARIVLGHVSDRIGGRRDSVLMLTGASGAALACLLAVLPRATALVALAPIWLLLGAAMVGWNALMLTWAGERVTQRNAGAAIGLTTSAVLLGATVSAPAFGLIVEASRGYSVAWLMLGGLLAVVAVLLWVNARWEARPQANLHVPESDQAAIVRRV
jgi:MFS family permease